MKTSLPPVVDAFLFFNELDLLEIRLHELQDVVHRHLLVELSQTHSGLPHESVWLQHQNEERFAPFRDRIQHVLVRDVPYFSRPEERENFHRNCLRLGLGWEDPEAYVLVSDADEIPRAEAVVEATKIWRPVVFEQDFFYYWMNCRRPEPWLQGTKGVRMKHFINGQHLRMYPGAQVLRGAGWHFSYLGGVERIREKLQSFYHQEYNEPEFRDLGWIQRCMTEGRDLFGRPDHRWKFLSGREHLPKYVREQGNRFAHYLAPEPSEVAA